MSAFEIVLLISACSVPIIAILFVVKPRLKRRHLIPHESAPSVSKESTKLVEDSELVKAKDADKSKEYSYSFMNRGESTDEFRDYLKEKKSRIEMPTKIELTDDLPETTQYVRHRKIARSNKEKSIIEQVEGLSPEMMALVFSGVFDNSKYFH